MIRVGGHITHITKRGKNAIQLASLRGSDIFGLGILKRSGVQVVIGLHGAGIENLEKKYGNELQRKIHGRKFEIRIY